MPKAVDKYKICYKCKQRKPIREFWKLRSSPDGLQPDCKSCKSAYKDTHKEWISARDKIYRAKNKEHYQAHYRKYRKEVRDKFFEMYGNRCACCGESEREFLTIEHKVGVRIKYKDGRRDSLNEGKEAIQEYRPDLYETLCMNCNHAKGRLGYCPHQTERR